MRISDWAGRFNIRVRPNEERPDNPQGDVVYRVKEVFTTRDGSWEPSNKPGGIPQWARDEHIRPWGAPDYFDDAGGDHHLFARVLDEAGQPVKDQDLILYWSDGFHKLGDSGFQGFVRMTPKTGSGWANQVVFNSFNPDRDESGAWCWCPRGAADVVEGGGLPNNQHVSFFAVWQAERRQQDVGSGTHGDTDTTDTDEDAEIAAELSVARLRRAAWRATELQANPSAPLALYARRQNLGAPWTAEFDLEGYRVQGFAKGIVYAPIGQWDQAKHRRW